MCSYRILDAKRDLEKNKNLWPEKDHTEILHNIVSAQNSIYTGFQHLEEAEKLLKESGR